MALERAECKAGFVISGHIVEHTGYRALRRRAQKDSRRLYRGDRCADGIEQVPARRISSDPPRPRHNFTHNIAKC